MRRISIVIFFLLTAHPAFAYKPCIGPQFDARDATAGSLRRQAIVQALSEDLVVGTDAFRARVRALIAAPTGDMTTTAAAAQSAADVVKGACESAAAAAQGFQ